MGQTDDGMLTLAEAARVAERHPETIRRWVRDGVLTRHAGPVPVQGGSVALRIDRAELLAYLVTSGQEPRPPHLPVERLEPPAEREGQPNAPQHSPALGVDTERHTVQQAGQHGSAFVDLEALRARLASVESRLASSDLREQVAVLKVEVELTRARGDVETLRVEVEALRARLVTADRERMDALRERDEWRERHDAREAELAALRTVHGPWWRRLLTG